LFDDVCPRTCKNFRSLCNGFARNGKQLCYAGTKLRLTPNRKMVQGGDISELIGKDESSYSMFEKGEFADESFNFKHDKTGLVGMY